MIGEQEAAPPKPGELTFHPLNVEEYRFPKIFGGTQLPPNISVRPKHMNYVCGSCGNSTNGRVLCEMIRESDNAAVSWCVCSCGEKEPSVLIEKDGATVKQIPLAKVFHAQPDWPHDIAKLYDEAAAAYCAGAFTASSMVCRKLLMACACDKGADAGQAFTKYVDYITNNILTYTDAKSSIDKIRGIGNDANHKIEIVNKASAEQAMKIVTYMLNTIYSLPNA